MVALGLSEVTPIGPQPTASVGSLKQVYDYEGGRQKAEGGKRPPRRACCLLPSLLSGYS